MKSKRAEHHTRRKEGKAALAVWGKVKVEEDVTQRRENYKMKVNTGNK